MKAQTLQAALFSLLQPLPRVKGTKPRSTHKPRKGESLLVGYLMNVGWTECQTRPNCIAREFWVNIVGQLYRKQINACVRFVGEYTKFFGFLKLGNYGIWMKEEGWLIITILWNFCNALAISFHSKLSEWSMHFEFKIHAYFTFPRDSFISWVAVFSFKWERNEKFE